MVQDASSSSGFSRRRSGGNNLCDVKLILGMDCHQNCK